jgi:hypothetical protein
MFFPQTNSVTLQTFKEVSTRNEAARNWHLNLHESEVYIEMSLRPVLNVSFGSTNCVDGARKMNLFWGENECQWRPTTLKTTQDAVVFLPWLVN